MPTELLDFQHELLAPNAAGGLVFGKVGTTYFTLEHPQIAPSDDRFGDVDLEREDGIAFGEDYSGGKTINFELGIGTWDAEDPHVAGADALEDLESAWRDPIYRGSAAQLAVLRSRAVPGRTRRAYGRPRRYAETTSRTSHRGYSTAVCDFQTVDGKWYDDLEQTKTVQPNLLSSGAAKVTIGGKVATWPVITFRGPLVQPVFWVGALDVRLTEDVAAGQTVTFDPRPWQRTMLRSDGANFAGKVTPQTTPMQECFLKPGTYTTGLLSFGSGSVDVKWRPAYSRW